MPLICDQNLALLLYAGTSPLISNYPKNIKIEKDEKEYYYLQIVTPLQPLCNGWHDATIFISGGAPLVPQPVCPRLIPELLLRKGKHTTSIHSLLLSTIAGIVRNRPTIIMSFYDLKD